MKKTMKPTRRVLSLLLVLAMVCTLLPLTASAATVASGTCGANVTWVLDDAGTLTISGTGAMKDYGYYGDVPWYENKSAIKSVVIRNGVTSIGYYAFRYCINLTSVTIPGSVTSIGGSAFPGCTALTELTIPGSVTSIGITAFYGCTALTELTIPKSVTFIGESAFGANGLRTIEVAEGNPAYKTVDGVLFTKDGNTLMAYPAGRTGDYTIPDGTTEIDRCAFEGSNGLTNLTIPDSVTSIDYAAFRYCRALTSVTIPNSVTSMGQSAFYGCKSLTDLTISDGVTSISSGAFCDCSALTSVTIPDSVTSIDSSAFGNSGVTDVYTNRTQEEWSQIRFFRNTFPTGAYFHFGDASQCAYTMNQDADGHWKECTCGVVTSVSAHVEEILPATAATCTEDGMTEGSKCSACGWIITAQETIPATGHTEEIIPGKPATCTEDGLTEEIKCSVCGVTLKAQETIPATGHDYTAVVTAPTCTEQGYTTYTCHCGNSYVADYVDSTGHDWDEGVVTTDPACESEGVKTFTCGNNAEHTYTEPVSATGHTEEIIPGKAATCTEDGLTDGSKCSVCGEILKAQETIPAAGHTEETIPAKPAVCPTPGLTEGSKCGVCGEIFKAQEPIIVTCSSADFKDLDTGAWYHEYTDFVIENGYMNGYPGKLFAPGETLSRAMTVQILYNLEGRPAVSGEDAYTDTAPEKWYTDAILWAAQNGVAVGYGDGTFGPDDPITREQMATVFYRYSELKGYDLTAGSYSQFPDAGKVSEYARTAMGWAVGKGLLVGMDDGTLCPTCRTTRAQAAAILNRFIETFVK